MKILYTLNSGQRGGMEQHVLDLVKGMVSEGNEVFVWCASGPMVEVYKNAGAEVTIQPINLDIDPFYISRLYKFLTKNKIDVLHAHELKAVSSSLLAGALAKTSVRISHTHTPISEWKISYLKKRMNIMFDNLLVNLFATREIALTESRRSVKESEGIKDSKLVVIPNGLNLAEFSLSPEQKQKFKSEIMQRYNISDGTYVFGNISRISKEKGHKALVVAYADVCKSLENQNIPNNTFLFIGGGGPLEDELKSKVKELNIEDRVLITERFAEEDLQKFYATFDSFVFPSMAEGFGIVLIEAMAFSLPILCSDLEVLQEVGGSTVRYFETGSKEDLVAKMMDLYKRQDQYYGFGNKARRRVEEIYSIDLFVSRYLDLYKELSV